MNKILKFFLLLFICNISYSQNEMKLYKSIFKTADSLKNSGKILVIDNTIYQVAKELDKQHPQKFFEKSAEYLAQSKFNEASFLYYVGLMRYRYYNLTNPNYQDSNDGALLGSLKYAIGEPVNMYLKIDIDNFISILKKATNYYSENDYLFQSKSKDIEKYMAQNKSYLELITELESNKQKYSDEWNSQMKKFKDAFKE